MSPESSEAQYVKPIADLREMTDAQLIDQHDELASRRGLAIASPDY
jgi:hypothetical protein